MKTILIIDDNLDYRTYLMEILEFENYDALEAENGLVGLQMIRYLRLISSSVIWICQLWIGYKF